MDESVVISDGDLCRWFATIFARELPGPVVDAYMAGAATPYLDAVSTRCNIALERIAMEAAVEDWSALDNPTRQLATDFASLFLIPGKAAALPYASYHVEQTFFGDVHDRMVMRLNAAGLSVAPTENGPADHLAVMLEYLAHILEADCSDAVASKFTQEDLLPLAVAVSRGLGQLNPTSPFYPSVSRILTCYLKSFSARR